MTAHNGVNSFKDGTRLNSFGSGEEKPISLRTLLWRDETKGVETYRMNGSEELFRDDQILLLKRTNIYFEDQECIMLNFTNITTFYKLKKEQE